ISNDRRVEVRSFRAGNDWRRNDHPLCGVPFAKVPIVPLASEGVKAQAIVCDLESRLATIAVDFLRPYSGCRIVLERTIILGAALNKAQRILSAYGKALELQRRQTVIQVDQLVRHSVEQTLAVGGVRCV